MHLIAHRKNTIAELIETPTQYGIEVDIRSRGQDLIIHHDPFADGEDFREWIPHYQHGTLILNVKEEGLETVLLDLMKTHGIEDFFFLDQSFPFLIHTSRAGERRCAVRVSEFEHAETALSLAGKVEWVWVDCFTKFPLDAAGADRLIDAGFKLCLVSPELQGRPAEASIPEMRTLLSEQDIPFHAVCTKRPDLWETDI